jgi:hypothetical protein
MGAWVRRSKCLYHSARSQNGGAPVLRSYLQGRAAWVGIRAHEEFDKTQGNQLAIFFLGLAEQIRRD